MTEIFAQVRTMLGAYTGMSTEDFDMSEDLDLTYDMDSTELTEVAKRLAQQYDVIVAKSDRADWKTGNDIVAFLSRSTSETSFAAVQS